MKNLFCTVVLIACAAAALASSGPSFWTIATSAEFLKGTSDGVLVSAEGILRAGPALTNRLTSTPAQVWSVAEGADGTLWAGTSGDGKLLRLRPGQAEEVAFDADEASIFAVAVSGNRTYAASSPDGRVYLIDGSAPARPFFDPQEKYIWALAVDGSGRLWVGAGNPAVIYRVDAAGTGQPIYRPPAGHVVALSRDSQNRILAGTESPGRVYRIGSDDRPFAMLDSGLTEVRALASAADGVTFAAAMTRGDDSSGGSAETPALIATVSPPAPPTGATSTSSSTRRSVLFRIDANGSWESLWETPDLIYDLSVTEDGSVLAATGPDGRLYRVERGRNVMLLTGVDAKQITRFAGPVKAGATVPSLATANPGRVMSAGTAPGPASFTSPVKDSKSIATWGLIRWEGTGGATLFTRSGNTEKPDDTWTDWAGPYDRSEGQAIQSPPARFVQWKVVLGRGVAPSQITSVTVAYLPRNGRPVVSSLTVHPPGVVFARPFSSDDGAIAGLDDVTADARRPPGDSPNPSAPGRRMFQKGLQTFAWKAEDPDADRLSYTIQFRREGESTWRDLKSGLLDSMFVWDTTSVADGRYVVRVRATDSATNSADRVLTGERESDPFDVDNTPPVVTAEVTRSGTSIRLAVRARDARSPIQKLEYSVAGTPWQTVYPTDGLADSPDERYEITLPADADLTRVVLRATDLLQNVGSLSVGR
jgi:hypothetical protein